MGKIKELYLKYKEIINYLIVGGLTTVISLISYYALVFTILSPDNAVQLQLANIISWIISVAFAYFTNRKFVFESKNPNKLKEATKFVGSRISTLLLDMLIMYVGVTLLGFNDKIIKIVSQVVVIVGNYIISKFFVFNAKKINLNNFVEKFLIIFLCIQPIFDIKIFYNSYSTLIRVIIILLIFIYYFIKSDNKKKYWMLVYPAILGVYFAFHHVNALRFNSLVPGNFDYSVVKESLYFVKMICPFLLIYSLYKSSQNNNKIVNVIKVLVAIISITIIVTNILGISYQSYGSDKIKQNFFSWFNTDLSYVELASKGFFEYANQISAILIAFLPFTAYSVLKNNELKKKAIDICILVANVFALILLCTKVAVLGILVVFGFTIVTFAFISFIQKKGFNIKKYVPLLTVLIVYVAILPVNPMFNRIDERNDVIEASAGVVLEHVKVTDNESDEEKDVSVSKAEMIEFIENNYTKKKVHEQFLVKNYPYKYDPEFWYNFLQTDISLTTDYRYIEKSMVKRVIEINNNKMDILFGITNTRLQNIFNIERDFVVQYYALGIIGLILVFLPYFGILAFFAYKTIKSKFKNLNVINLLSFISIIFAFGISYFSGNLLNSLNFTIYFALLFKLMIKD